MSVAADGLRGHTEADNWSVVFEFELPFEGGRRPDVIVLAGETIVVLEFKQSPQISAAHFDQVQAYARDLAEYHEASHFRRVEPVLVATNERELDMRRGNVRLVGRERVAEVLARLATPGHIESAAWLSAPYAPLPALVAAARRIFRHERLPHVRRALDERVPERIATVQRLIADAEATGRRHLILVTGSPGAGKTLVGLRVVYEHGEGAPAATMLSGNGPLVKVLQSALGSTIFVRDIHKFIASYATGKRNPTQHVIVFDEAQRAWDRGYMLAQRGLCASEPDLLIGIAERLPNWAAIVGLVGSGQEIFSGEEAGIAQWATAIHERSADPSAWRISCPASHAHYFEDLDVRANDDLQLTASLRSRRADSIHEWVAAMLRGNLEQARKISGEIDHSSFPMYVTRDLDAARTYLRDLYPPEHEDKRFGLLSTSHSKKLRLTGQADFDTAIDWMAKKRFRIENWFNAERSHRESCCSLDVAISEFDCQGLEVDLPVVCWGEELQWHGDNWVRQPKRRKYRLTSPEQLLENAYRVLLTRGRDGLIVWVPSELEEMDETYGALLEAGMRELSLAAVTG